MPDGSKFSGVDGLRAALLTKSDVFVETFVEKLLVYSLGRGVEYYDAPTVRQIARNAATQNNRFSRLILGVVKSTPFQMRASSGAPVTVGTSAQAQSQATPVARAN
jgi:hypothetical protein